jgi:hypothetical protein
MGDVDDHLARLDLLVGERLGDRIDGRDRHAAAQRSPLPIVLAKARAEDRRQGDAIGEPAAVESEARVAPVPAG